MAKKRPIPEGSEWFEVPFDVLPPGPHKKLRLMADAQFPKAVAEELQAAGIDLKGPDATLRGRDHLFPLGRWGRNGDLPAYGQASSRVGGGNPGDCWLRRAVLTDSVGEADIQRLGGAAAPEGGGDHDGRSGRSAEPGHHRSGLCEGVLP